MCIDLFTVHHPITITLLHEQVWFRVEDTRLEAAVVCDAFIRNDSSSAIDEIRIQFPHYVGPEDIVLLSTSAYLAPRKNDVEQFNWLGKFTFNQQAGEINFDFELHDPSLETVESTFQNIMILEGSFPPSGIVPAVLNKEYLDDMSRLDGIALDLHLKTPLPAGRVGWLRLKLCPKNWPHLIDRIELPPFEFLEGSHRFKTQIQIVSPVHLRHTLRKEIKEKADEWEDVLINQGWRQHDTLVRVDDHRISLVFPKDMEVSHVLCVPESAILGIGPLRSELVGDQYLLHFATGSNLNKRRDVVSMALSVCDYCEYLQTREEAPTKEHLVTRCGGADHESVGTLISEMLKARILRTEDGRVWTALGHERESRLLDLRRRYTFPEAYVPFLDGMRELHPFTISFAVRWTAFNERQNSKIKTLHRLLQLLEKAEGRQIDVFERLLDFLNDASTPRKPSRRAIIVGCYEYQNDSESAFNYPQILDITLKLKREFDEKRCFDKTDRVLNPRDADQILNAFTKVLDEVGEGGTCLIWYLGHAMPGDDSSQLELRPTGKGSIGLEWRRVVDLLARYKRIAKIVVLDCCHAGLVKDAKIPERTYVWPTTGPNHTAEAGLIGEEDPAGNLPNFTYLAVRQLRTYRDEDSVTFRELLTSAQEHAIANCPTAPIVNGFGSEPLLIDPQAQKPKSFDEFISYIGKSR